MSMNRIGILFCAMVVFTAFACTTGFAKLELDPDGLIQTDTRVPVDSVTVGQRFVLTHTFTFPDSLVMLPVTELKTGKCRILNVEWAEQAEEDVMMRTSTLTLLTLNLTEAVVPSMTFDFLTPSGDTLRVYTEELVIPVASMTATSTDIKPLKDQWVAPRSWMPLLIACGLILALGVLVWWALRRHRKREAEPQPELRLPADYEALTALTAIERLDLLSQGEFKRYYTLVVDVLRRYLENRFGVDAMDRTTDELVDELTRRKLRVPELDRLLREADMVKFAKYVPPIESGETVMHRAREIVITTTPRNILKESSGETDEPEARPDDADVDMNLTVEKASD